MNSKRRKIGKGKYNRFLHYLRIQLLKLIDGKDVNELTGILVYTRNWGYGKQGLDWVKVVKSVLDKNESEKFRKFLMKRKKKIYKDLGGLYTSYIFSDPQNQVDDDNEDEEEQKIPKQMQDRVFQLVHYFYHGKLPLDNKLKTFAALRREEKEVLGEYDPTDFVNIEFFFGDKKKAPITIPRDVLWVILSYVPHNYENLVGVGLVNEKFFVSFLMTWYNLKIYPVFVKQISLLALKSAKEVSFIDKKSFRRKYERSYNWGNLYFRPRSNFDDEKEEKNDPSALSDFESAKVKYLFTDQGITLRRIRVLDFSMCTNISSFLSLLRGIFCQKLVFPACQKLIFPTIPFKQMYEHDVVDSELGTHSPYTLKRKVYGISYKYVIQQKTTSHCFTPNIVHVENTTLESLMLFPPEVIRNQMRVIRIYLFRKDSSVLSGCGLRFSQCEDLAVHPREILSSNYMDKIFLHIQFPPDKLQRLTIGVSSNEEIVDLSSQGEILSNSLQQLTLDFESNGSVIQSNEYFECHDLQELSFPYKNEKNFKSIKLINFPVTYLTTPPNFLRSTEFPDSVTEFEIHYDDGTQYKQNQRTRGEYDPSAWRNGFSRASEKKSFNLTYPFGLSLQNRVFRYEEVTLRMNIKSQTIDVFVSKKGNEIISEENLYVLVHLQQSLCEANSPVRSNYRYVNVIYTSTIDHLKSFKKQCDCLLEFLEEYYKYFCDIKQSPSNEQYLLHQSKSSKVNQKKTNEIEEILKDCKICISQIGNPERTRIRDLALRLGGTYSPQITPEVTHLIVPSGNRARKNVEKVESALSNNRRTFVVSSDWIYECGEDEERIDEEEYRLFSDEEIKGKIGQEDDDDDDEEKERIENPFFQIKGLEKRYEVNLEVRNFKNKKFKRRGSGVRKNKHPSSFVPKF